MSVPDSARVAWVRLALLHFDDVQVVTDSTKILVHRPVVALDGLRLTTETGSWGISSSTWMSRQERLVAWGGIESIHARKGAGGSGVVIGGLVGLTIGGLIALANTSITLFGPTKTSGTPVLVGIALGAGLGALTDLPGPWESVYP